MPSLFKWTRLASARWEDSWRESLRFAGETRLAIFSLPGGSRIRLELYSLSRAEAGLVAAQFGGKILRQPSDSDIIARQPQRPPLRIRDRLLIVDDATMASSPAQTIVIPAGMAFGTGDHATTATCLRLLADLSRDIHDWSMLDLGTGSGILAIAAHRLGARRIEGCDFDPDAVRIARENAERNSAAAVRFIRRDVTRWKPRSVFDVVTANLFQRVLLEAAPAIAAAVAPGGHLIFSGVLREQAAECQEAFVRHGLQILKSVSRGKWRTVLGQKVQG